MEQDTNETTGAELPHKTFTALPHFPVKSEKTNEITPALIKAIQKMGAVVKNKENPHYRSKYADLASFIEASKEALAENGIVCLQPPIYAPPGNIRVVTILEHVSGQFFQSDVSVPMAKNDAQAFGSALTYVRRYCLASMVGLAPEDDDGTLAVAPGKTAPAPTKAAPAPTKAQVIQGPALANNQAREVVDAPPPDAAKPTPESAIADLMARIEGGEGKTPEGITKLVETAGYIKKMFPGIETTEAWKVPQAAFMKAYQESQAKAGA